MNWPPTAEEWDLMQRKVGRQAARIARLEEEREEDSDRISALEDFAAGGRRHDPVALVAWIKRHCPLAGASEAPRYKLTRLKKPGATWPTHAEAEELVREFGGEAADLPGPDELLRLVDAGEAAA